LCNSITLTPGTLAVDIHDDGTMMVHWIYVRSLDEDEAARQIIGRFEWFIQRIFE
jgi:multisubunit Na+/H+ antiporter MnhE subunit